MPPLWRQAFDRVERPLAASAESWVQSETFMDLTAVAVKLQRRLGADFQRRTEQWLALCGLVSRADAVRLMNQVGGLEREVRELGRRLDQRESGTQLRSGRSREQARRGPRHPEKPKGA